MWIIDKIRSFLTSIEESIDKTPLDHRAILDQLDAGIDRVNFDDEPVETLYVEYEDGTPVPAQGILKDMGYRVGKNGLLRGERREILRRTFRIQLDSNSDWYIRQWGPRCSQARFNKMDRVLGGLAANAERIRKNDMSEAIRNWREDQAWLRQTYRSWMDHNH